MTGVGASQCVAGATGEGERGNVGRDELDALTATPRTWEILLPWSTPPVKPNGGHGNIYAHAAKVKSTRQTMGLLARKAGIPWLGRCEIQLTWYVPDRIKRDADNLVWSMKPLADALAGNKPHDHKIVEDDTPELMVKHMPAILYRPGQPKQMFIHITELPEVTK